MTSGSYLTGSYNAAGTLANFNGSQADGNWTLYFTALANGGGTSLVEGRSLNITAVPEPVNFSLAIFDGAAGIFALRRLVINRKNMCVNLITLLGALLWP